MDKLKALFENANLPTDFANKASVLFEASMNEAVEARVKQEVARIQEAAEDNLEKEKEAWIKESEEDVEKFLDKEVKEWAEKNSAALAGTIKAQIAESILSKFRAVLESEGVELPDEKEKAVKEAEEDNEKLKEEVEDLKGKLEEAKAVIQGHTKAQIIAEATKGLSKVAASRISSLSESITFKNVRQFSTAIATITEGVTGKKLKIKEDAEADSKYPATDDNSNSAGADKNKAAVEPNTKVTEDAESDKDEDKKVTESDEDSDNKFFEAADGEDDEDKEKVQETAKTVKEDVGVDNEVNTDGSGDASQDPQKVTEGFDIVALTLKSMRTRV